MSEFRNWLLNKQSKNQTGPLYQKIKGKEAINARLTEFTEVFSLVSGNNFDKDFFIHLIQTDEFHEVYGDISKLKTQAQTLGEELSQLKYLDGNGKMYTTVLALCREGTESTVTGQRVVEMRSKCQRRLYAILRPSVDENLQRIRNVLYYAGLMLDFEEHQLFLFSLSKYERALRIANEFDAGWLPYSEAVELLDEIFG